MAAVKAAQVYPSQNGAARVRIYTWGLPTAVPAPGNAGGNTPTVDPNAAAITPWATLKSGDTCLPEFMPNMTDRSMHVTGTASGASVTLQGSNDGVNYVTLTDVFGNPISAVAPGTITQINQQCLWVKPVVTGGDGSTSMNVIITGKLTF